MSRNVTQSLFQATPMRSSWQSYLTSGIVHVIIFIAIAAITVPAIPEFRRPLEHIALLAPVLSTYKPKVEPVRRVETPKLVVHNEPKKLPVIKPPVVKPPEVKPRLLAAAPEIKAVPVPPAAHPLPEPKFDVPAPKPEIKTGVFQLTEQAKGPQDPKLVKVGGFGDPNGVPNSANPQPSALTMARVGSFDMPQGSGSGGGGGKGAAGGVKAAGFGSVDGVPGGTGNSNGTVRTGGFGDSSAPAPAQAYQRPHPVQPAITPVEILFKPKPVYTQEARNLKIEGQVSLEVVFASNGSVRVVRVMRGLGHGLDEAAQQAALQVRFKPAMREGVPVDTNATISIIFELT